jgi:hypothetical protein
VLGDELGREQVGPELHYQLWRYCYRKEDMYLVTFTERDLEIDSICQPSLEEDKELTVSLRNLVCRIVGMYA